MHNKNNNCQWIKRYQTGLHCKFIRYKNENKTPSKTPNLSHIEDCVWKMGNKGKKHPAFLLWTPPQDNWVIVEEHFSLYRNLSVNEEGMIKITVL